MGELLDWQEEVAAPVHFGANSRMLGPKVERKKCMATLFYPQALQLCIGSDCKSHGFPRAKSEPGMAGEWERAVNGFFSQR